MSSNMDEWCLIDFMNLDVLANKIIEVRFDERRNQGRLWETTYPQQRNWTHPVFDRQLVIENGLENWQPSMSASQDVEVMERILKGLEAAAFGDSSYLDTLPSFKLSMAYEWMEKWHGRIQGLVDARGLEVATHHIEVCAVAKSRRI